MKNTEFVDICKQMDLLDFTTEYKSELESEWNNINWELSKRQIFKLQEKIFHAVKENNDHDCSPYDKKYAEYIKNKWG